MPWPIQIDALTNPDWCPDQSRLMPWPIQIDALTNPNWHIFQFELYFSSNMGFIGCHFCRASLGSETFAISLVKIGGCGAVHVADFRSVHPRWKHCSWNMFNLHWFCFKTTMVWNWNCSGKAVCISHRHFVLVLLTQFCFEQTLLYLGPCPMDCSLQQFSGSLSTADGLDTIKYT